MNDEVYLGPGYQVIRGILLSNIRSGHWAVGSQIPSIRVLATRFHCTEAMVRNALSGLQTAGYVRSEHGRGSWVADPLPYESLDDPRDRAVAAIDALRAYVNKLSSNLDSVREQLQSIRELVSGGPLSSRIESIITAEP